MLSVGAINNLPAQKKLGFYFTSAYRQLGLALGEYPIFMAHIPNRVRPCGLGLNKKKRQFMYPHIKKLMYTVRVGSPDPRFGNMLLEQFGGANGELAAAMQYSIQGLNCTDPARKDLLMDIGTEELSHLEIVHPCSHAS
jgi:hypothetical protein